MKESRSKYYYPDCDVLVNKFNIKDEKQLEIMERILTSSRLLELMKKPIAGNFDLKHLSRIHNYIFKDVYEFSGQLRNEGISKGFQFPPPAYINDSAKILFNDLKKESYLVGLDSERFSERAAHYMAEINVLHPFREGNGRSTREFIRCLGLKNGFEIEWSQIDKDLLFEATVRSKNDTKLLENAIKECVVNKETNKELAKYMNTSRDFELER